MQAVFLDRDGVINKKIENGYVLDWKDFVFLPGAIEAIKWLNDREIPVYIISNQACVGKGMISGSKLADINDRMQKEMKLKGAHIDDIFICPHNPEENCNCRKPRTGLFEQAAKKYKIDFEGSWFIGDSESDMNAGKDAGCKTYLIKKGENLKDIIENILS